MKCAARLLARVFNEKLKWQVVVVNRLGLGNFLVLELALLIRLARGLPIRLAALDRNSARKLGNRYTRAVNPAELTLLYSSANIRFKVGK